MELKLPHDHGEGYDISAIIKVLSEGERFSSAAELFKQLCDPTRLRIFWLLCHREECVCNLSALLGMSSPAVSHHLRALRDSGLVDTRRDGKEVYYKVADSRLCMLLHPTLEQVLELTCPESGEGESTAAIIRRVHDYLLGHLAERITIDELSRKFHINPTTLKEGFKREYGNSIAAHINGHRMEAAAELLQKSADSINDIARAVGYESQSRFSAAFCKFFGLLPTEYRKQKNF